MFTVVTVTYPCKGIDDDTDEVTFKESEVITGLETNLDSYFLVVDN